MNDTNQRKSARKAAAGTPTAAAGTAAVMTAPVMSASPLSVLTRGSFLALTTRPGTGGSHALAAGDLSRGAVQSGLASLANAAATVLGPLLPARMAGLSVNETLHRLDANAHPPTLERGVTAANRVGDALGAITMRMLLAPDDFEASPSATPPSTEI